MPELTPDQIFDLLDEKHPDYEEWESEWKRYRDVMGDALVNKSEYLPQNKFEPADQYEFRLDLTEFIPESGLAVDRLLGALYSEKPKRELKGVEAKLKAFQENANRRGKSWNALVEDIGFQLLTYGTTRVLVNVPVINLPPVAGAAEDESSVTRDVEQALGIRPYVVIYNPLNVVDWETNADGEPVMVRVKEERIVNDPTSTKKRHKEAVRFIQYDTMQVEWWDFKKTDTEKWSLEDHDSRLHGLGIVPMVIEAVREIKPMIGQSFIRYAARADIQKLRAESDLVYDTYLHAHPLLLAWINDELKEVGIGSNTYIKLNPGVGGAGREDVQYCAAPGSAFEALQQLVTVLNEKIYRQAKIDPMSIASAGSSAVFQASGAARAWSFGTSEARTLSKVADHMEVVERRVFELVLRFQDTGTLPPPEEYLFKGDIQYPEEFDTASTTQLIEETGAIVGSTVINSPRLARTLHKRIAASKVGDTTAKVLQEIQKEIEDNPLVNTAVGQKSPSVFQMPQMPGMPGQAGPAPPPGKPPAKEGEEDEEEGGEEAGKKE